jgi:PadR family transcriptional regulator PadR
MRANSDMTDLRWLSQVKRGLLELCILNLLHREGMYGYQMVKRLTSVPGLVSGAGTVYPLLSRLKRDGLLTSSLEGSPQGPARRTYVLTPAGRRHMRSINEAWREIAEAVDAFMAGEN